MAVRADEAVILTHQLMFDPNTSSWMEKLPDDADWQKVDRKRLTNMLNVRKKQLTSGVREAKKQARANKRAQEREARRVQRAQERAARRVVAELEREAGTTRANPTWCQRMMCKNNIRTWSDLQREIQNQDATVARGLYQCAKEGGQFCGARFFPPVKRGRASLPPSASQFMFPAAGPAPLDM